MVDRRIALRAMSSILHLFANGQFLKRVSCGIVELHNNYGPEALERDVAAWGFHVLEPTSDSGLEMISIWPKTLHAAEKGTRWC